jgi:hypothetical protein
VALREWRGELVLRMVARVELLPLLVIEEDPERDLALALGID